MSFIFGGGRGRVDPELAEGRRRAELRLARDIGDHNALMRDLQPPRRRVRMWPVVLVAVVMVLGAFGLLPRISRVDITRSCSTPAVALEKYDTGTNAELEWKATGPADGDYVLVAGGGTVTAERGQVQVSDGGIALSPVFSMTDCLVDQTLATPAQPGTYPVRLMHRDRPDGEFTEVASVQLRVR